MIYDEESDREYIEYVFSEIKAVFGSKKIKILNAGCGNNWIKKHAPKSFEIIGLDINNPKADILADLDQRLPIKDSAYDAVILMHVIEHLKSPIFTLQECSRILKKGGLVYISTPSPWSANAWEDPYHLRPFTLNSVKVLGQDAGLDSVKGFYSNNTPGFGLLKLNKLKKFYYWFTMRLTFLNTLSFFRGNVEILLRKK